VQSIQRSAFSVQRSTFSVLLPLLLSTFHSLLPSRQQRQAQLFQEGIVLVERLLHGFLNVHQALVRLLQIDLLLPHRGADVERDVEVEPNSARGLSETDNAQRWAQPD